VINNDDTTLAYSGYLVDLTYLKILETARTGVDRQGRNGYRVFNAYHLDRVSRVIRPNAAREVS
jgi:hypothetical protein